MAGARCPWVPHHALVRLPAGAELTLGTPQAGLRSYLGVRGGVDVPAALGSRATDLLSGIGPAPLSDGDVVPVGRPTGALPGPRRDWFDDVAWEHLTDRPWSVDSQSNRIAVGLEGTPVLSRTERASCPARDCSAVRSRCHHRASRWSSAPITPSQAAMR